MPVQSQAICQMCVCIVQKYLGAGDTERAGAGRERARPGGHGRHMPGWLHRHRLHSFGLPVGHRLSRRAPFLFPRSGAPRSVPEDTQLARIEQDMNILLEKNTLLRPGKVDLTFSQPETLSGEMPLAA